MNYKKAAAAATVVLCMGALTACSGSNEGKTYSNYMQGLLDARYKAEYATYMKLSEATKKESQDMYEGVIEYLVEGMYEYYKIDTDCLTDELEDGYWDLAVSLYKKADYTVNDAKKVDGDYHVVVDIKPMDFFDISYDEAADFAETYGSDISEEEWAEYTEEDVKKWEIGYAEGMLELLKPYVDKVSYGDVISLDNKVTIKNTGYKEKEYSFDDDDIYKIDDYVLGLTEEDDESSDK